MRKVILLFLLFLSVDTVRTQGQNITFSHLTTDDGLSQFSVNSMYIDEQGIIWIGTREGLNRYNGNDIKSFKLKKNDPNSLFSNTVLRITGNRNGKVYLLCTDGVAEFDLATQRFRTLLQGNVDAIYFNEKLYIGKREEVFVYNESTGNFDLFYHLAGKNITLSCLHLDKNKNLWMGTTSNGIYCLSEDKSLSRPVTKGNITSIYEDSSNELWIGSWSAELSAAPDYFAQAKPAIEAMMAQAGHPVFDADGILQRGVILRHLALPGHVDDSFAVLDQMAAWNDADPGCFLPSVMSQYTPFYKAAEHGIGRRITTYEYHRVVNYAMDKGLVQGYMQQKSSAKEEYTPSFDLTGV